MSPDPSSTYYDLKHIRSSLELFIESLGFEPVLSEKGDIPYNPDHPLDESCYREAGTADLFVLVVGGRYGSEISGSDTKSQIKFYDHYESITKKEFESAQEMNIPVFVLVETGVFAEYQTYLKNRTNNTVSYAHVDSVNVFRFIESILARQKNNPVFQFERSSQIEAWLREQWAGLFRDLLRNRSQQKQISTLTTQVADLKEVNKTLKHYLEAVLTQVAPDSQKVIQDEESRLVEAKRFEELKSNDWFNHLVIYCDLDEDSSVRSISEPVDATSAISLLQAIETSYNKGDEKPSDILRNMPLAQEDYNEAREIIGKDRIDFSNIIKPPSRRRKISPSKKNTEGTI